MDKTEQNHHYLSLLPFHEKWLYLNPIPIWYIENKSHYPSIDKHMSSDYVVLFFLTTIYVHMFELTIFILFFWMVHFSIKHWFVRTRVLLCWILHWFLVSSLLKSICLSNNGKEQRMQALVFCWQAGVWFCCLQFSVDTYIWSKKPNNVAAMPIYQNIVSFLRCFVCIPDYYLFVCPFSHCAGFLTYKLLICRHHQSRIQNTTKFTACTTTTTSISLSSNILPSIFYCHPYLFRISLLLTPTQVTITKMIPQTMRPSSHSFMILQALLKNRYLSLVQYNVQSILLRLDIIATELQNV